MPIQLEAVDTDRKWRSTFEDRFDRHASIARLNGTIDLDTGIRSALGRSLSLFQLGETGTGEHLVAAARDCGASPDHVAALRLFVREEQEHARLLALVLRSLGWPCRQAHWTDRVFVGLRRLRSLRTEVLILLVAEVVALTYYARLRDAVHHPVLTEVLARIHADEVVHVEFHAETLPALLAEWSTATRRLVGFGWNLIVAATSLVVALGHRRALRASGVSIAAFVRAVSRDRRSLSARLFGTVRG